MTFSFFTFFRLGVVGGGPPSSAEEMPLWVWIIIGIGALLIIAAIAVIIFVVKRREGSHYAKELKELY